MLVGPGVEKRVQQVAIDYHSVACVLDGQKCKVTGEGPTNLRVSTKSGVSGVFLEWFQEVWSSGELWSYNIEWEESGGLALGTRAHIHSGHIVNTL